MGLGDAGGRSRLFCFKSCLKWPQAYLLPFFAGREWSEKACRWQRAGPGPWWYMLVCSGTPGPWPASGHSSRSLGQLWAPGQDFSGWSQCRHPACDMSLDTASCCHPALLMSEADGKVSSQCRAAHRQPSFSHLLPSAEQAVGPGPGWHKETWY